MHVESHAQPKKKKKKKKSVSYAVAFLSSGTNH